ncbi:hypothetical protein, variant 1 [Aphanomyces invadans]|uniref:GOLD domain-containing protein n=1 Tax=Aphanomyces invadans TaxID=157072 RepID=A0A024TBI9_9STRA|nr:hypothetical protein, variant 1 [Aphanomyces invadans]ETV91520.1 hypothetical protein, variant 1 [Aphanomyces invadans]|eukprot:XP_008879787.1 hypothetical protein, variant 1 [Aphanomyces invadans]
MVAALLLPWVGVLALVSCFSSVGAGSSFAFDLDGNQEECFREDIVPRSLHSDLFVHFELLEPRRPTDALNVKVVSPSGVTITTWTHATANHTSLNVRESGLYSLCFTSAPGSKAQQRVLYVVDVVTYGTRSLTRDPTVIATLIQQFPDKPNPSTLMLATERGVPVSMGVVEYSFAGISVHALHENTRVIASFSVDFASKPGIEVTLAAIPGNRVVHPPTWTSMTTHIDSFYDRVITNHGVLASTGGSLFFDITDTVRAATAARETLSKEAEVDNASPSTVAFTIQVAEDGEVRLAGGAHAGSDASVPASFVMQHRRPTLSLEDLGLPVLQLIGRFRYAVWDLKGELVSIVQNERRSRDGTFPPTSIASYACPSIESCSCF